MVGFGCVFVLLNNLVGFKFSKGLLSICGVVLVCCSLDCVSIFVVCCFDVNCILDVVVQFDVEDVYVWRNVYENGCRYFSVGEFVVKLIIGVFGFLQLNFFGNEEV